jgi:hypothetical protein
MEAIEEIEETEEKSEGESQADPVVKPPGIDMRRVLKMLDETKQRMTDAPPWGCGLMAVIEQVCFKNIELQSENTELIKAVEDAQAEIALRKTETQAYVAEVKVLQDCLLKMSQLTSANTVNVEALQERTIKMDTQLRSKNLLFRGVPEDGKNSMDDCVAKIDNILERRLDLNSATIKISKCHRVGQIRQGSPRGATRPILVEFHWSFNKSQVLQRGYMLARSGISIEEDFPIEVVQRRATLNSIATRAKHTKGYEGSRVSGDRLLVKGRSYTVDTVSNLPEDINPITHATKTDGETTLFYSRYSKLSNHNPAPFTLDDVMYRSSEQFYFSEMCRLSGDDQQSLKVLAATDPKDCQRLGRQAKPNPNFNWAEHEKAVMTRGCMAKFTQNKPSRIALLRTAETTLGESSRSKHWGTGLYMDHPDAYNTRAWENNLLGRVLSSVRATIRSTMGTT